MHKWYSGKHSRSGSRTEDKGEICDGMHWKQDLPQLSTASLCSVSEACWATVLFSWLRSFDTTSRNAMLCTSFWRGSGKGNIKRNSALYELGRRKPGEAFLLNPVHTSTWLWVHIIWLLFTFLNCFCWWRDNFSGPPAHTNSMDFRLWWMIKLLHSSQEYPLGLPSKTDTWKYF